MAKNPSEDGFTLIELLVVMLILGVLAGIAIPSFVKQRDRAYSAKMQNDLHNAVLAEMSFNANNDTFTTVVADLVDEGYKVSDGVTPVHVKVVGNGYLACVKHSAVTHWLVYDSSNAETTTSSSDCV